MWRRSRTASVRAIGATTSGNYAPIENAPGSCVRVRD